MAHVISDGCQFGPRAHCELARRSFFASAGLSSLITSAACTKNRRAISRVQDTADVYRTALLLGLSISGHLAGVTSGMCRNACAWISLQTSVPITIKS